MRRANIVLNSDGNLDQRRRLLECVSSLPVYLDLASLKPILMAIRWYAARWMLRTLKTLLPNVCVFAVIHVILAPTVAVDSVALFLHIQHFPSFSTDVGPGYTIGEFASVSLSCDTNLGHASFHSLFNSLVTDHSNIGHCLFRAAVGTFK
jgi:hypothetical protein